MDTNEINIPQVSSKCLLWIIHIYLIIFSHNTSFSTLQFFLLKKKKELFSQISQSLDFSDCSVIYWTYFFIVYIAWKLTGKSWGLILLPGERLHNFFHSTSAKVWENLYCWQLSLHCPYSQSVVTLSGDEVSLRWESM